MVKTSKANKTEKAASKKIDRRRIRKIHMHPKTGTFSRETIRRAVKKVMRTQLVSNES
jgi:hypothetical protein